MKKARTVLLVIICIVNIYFIVNIDEEFKVHFLDVGQGDSILIETIDDQYLLIDGGDRDIVISELDEILPFWERKIDIVVCTHSDSDHASGLIEVLDRYEVEVLFVSDLNDNHSNNILLKDMAKRNDIEVYELQAYDDIIIGELKLQTLWPEKEKLVENVNDNSVVLYGEYKEYDFILTADIGKEQEKFILENGFNRDIDMIKVGHHGSDTSTSQRFIELLRPELAIISCGLGNKFGHPDKEVIQRLKEGEVKILRTDIHGRVETVYSESKLHVYIEK